MIKFGKLKIDPVAIGSQGNAILGIRDSGKTYTATLLAEGLHDAGIPFIAFDPIGVWRFLRVPGKGRGYPVVVAGGTDGDLPLTVAGAPEIVRAAMANGVSLVIDLFDINLSKADWKRIVTACVRVLLHENSRHGLRHVFIEEAAEFAPQRVGPDQGQVYAEMEKLARMGGNARLGYTLINQRAEEVNKALLELCDNLFLHRQKGRNSLTALSKWLDIGNVSIGKQIVSTLPTLPTGECWAWLQGSETPELIKVPVKNSLHPDRRIMRGDEPALAAKAVDVGSFVATMKGTLGEIETEAETVAELKAELAKLRRQKAPAEGVPEAEVQQRVRESIDVVAREARANMIPRATVHGWLQKLGDQIKRCIDDIAIVPKESALRPAEHFSVRPTPTLREAVARTRQDNKPRAVAAGIKPAQQRVLDVIAQLEQFGVAEPNKSMVAAHAGVSPTSGGYFNNLGFLRSAGLVEYPKPDHVALTDAGRAASNPPQRKLTLMDLHESWIDVVLPAQAKILREVIALYPSSISKDDLANRIDVSPTSGGYFNNLGRLRTLGAIDYPERGTVRATDLLFPKGKK